MTAKPARTEHVEDQTNTPAMGQKMETAAPSMGFVDLAARIVNPLEDVRPALASVYRGQVEDIIFNILAYLQTLEFLQYLDIYCYLLLL
jgi:hypothetical protein